MEPTDELVDLASLEARAPELAAAYAAAEPFPHLVLDDVLPASTIRRVYEELAGMDDGPWNSYAHYNERKFSNTAPDTWGPTLRSLSEVLAGDRFRTVLERISGFDDLLADPTLDGGGIHRCYRDGFLNIHADFTAHHEFPDWRRRVNLLLYLNPTWEPAWGGDLELWDASMQRCVTTVAPIGNRMLIFSTDERSYHGHPEPLRAPDQVARQSLALYYFTREANPPTRATAYRARPTDGARRVLIRADSKVLGAYDSFKRRFRISDHAAQRVMGLFVRRPK